MLLSTRNLIGSLMLLTTAITCSGCVGDDIDDADDDADEEMVTPDKTEQRMDVGMTCKDGSGSIVFSGTGYFSITSAQSAASFAMSDNSGWSCFAYTIQP